MELKFYKRDFLDFLLSTKTLKNTGETEKNSTPFAIKYAELNTGTGLKAVGRAIAESLHDIYSKKGINVVICDDNEILPFVITATLLFTESFKKELRFIDAQKLSEKKISKLLKKGDKIVVIGSRTSSYKLFSHLRKITEKNKAR